MDFAPRATGLVPREAEQAVLGALMLRNDALDTVAEIVQADDFGVSSHATIFRAVKGLIEAGKPADILATSDALRAAGSLNDVGGLVYLDELVSNAPAAANVRHHAGIVRERAQLRALRRATAAALEASEEKGRVAEIAAQLEAELLALGERSEGGPVFIKDAIPAVMEYLDQRAKNPCTLAGIGTGFTDFDRMTCGLEPGDLVVVGARPAMGKSAFGLNVASHVANRYGPTLFWSGEMPLRQLVLREIASASGVSMSDMRWGELNNEDWDRIGEVVARLASAPIAFDERTGMTPSRLRAAARKMKREHGLKLIVVDYIGLMHADIRSDSRNIELGSISRALKSLAKELGIPIIVLAQLNRANESRVDKRPMMSDLRDSGEIEQDADIIVFIHREEYYRPDEEQWHGIAELLCRKQRNGPVGDVQLAYDGHAVRFRDLDKDHRVKRDTAKPNAPQRKTFDD
jgi:replicative DNA helicase